MTEREQQLKRDRRLEAVAFLRDHDMQNKERIAQVNRILKGGDVQTPGTYTMPEPEEADMKAEKEFWKSFRLRCAAAMFLTILFYVGMMSSDAVITNYITTIKTSISKDYSENLFDFINRIPYTLDYEKINAKG